jgi:membrane-associated phospholipid phosphatase
MARHRLLALQPTAADLWVARRIARRAHAPTEHGLQVVTWAADEKVLMAVVGLAWLGIRLLGADARDRRKADHLALATSVSVLLPYLLKHLVSRKRPDRVVVQGRRHGVPRSGRPYDSFPSGHVAHLGAIASALVRWVPQPWGTAIWLTAAGLSATRVMLLAHWLTDVAAGLSIGVTVEALLHRYTDRSRGFRP